jgi:hydrogenase 3 maturation protease
MSNLLTDEIKKTLNLTSNVKTLIITIGNRLRSDDSVALYIAEKINNLPPYITLINAENKPENIIDPAVSIMPLKTIIIDAADFNGTPGEIRIIPNQYIPDTTLSTHTFPLKVIVKILEEDTKSKVYFLGIQIKNASLGEKISKQVKDSAEEIIEYLNSL